MTRSARWTGSVAAMSDLTRILTVAQIRSSYDTRNTNGGRGYEAVRLAGQWLVQSLISRLTSSRVSRHLAIHLAPAYGVSELVSVGIQV